MHFVGLTQANPYACTAAAIVALWGRCMVTPRLQELQPARQGLAPVLLQYTRRLGAARRPAARAGDGIGARRPRCRPSRRQIEALQETPGSWAVVVACRIRDTPFMERQPA
jgi:hypothetical protein